MDMLKVIQTVAKRTRATIDQKPIGEFVVLGALLIGVQVGLSSLNQDANSALPHGYAAPHGVTHTQASVELLTPKVPEPVITHLEVAQIEILVDLINPTRKLALSQTTDSVGINPKALNQSDIKHKDSIARFVFMPSKTAAVLVPSEETAELSPKAKVAATNQAIIANTAPNPQYTFKPSTDSKLGHNAKSNLFITHALNDKTLAIWSINKKFSLAGKRQKITAIKKRKPNDKFVIMLDPGHGGIDPGSVGHNGLEEKALTLEIAKRAALFLSEIDNIEVVLTRNSDTGMSRKNRVHKVKQSNADMVVSLHLNHLPQTDVNLVETFYAAPHNILKSIEKQRAEENTNGLVKTAAVHNHDLSFTKGSRQLANLMQKRVFDEVAHESPDTDNAGVKEDMLYILTRSFTPGVLIEMSCLSNVQEAERLSDPEYRDRLAAALADGIRDYLATPEAKSQFGPGV